MNTLKRQCYLIAVLALFCLPASAQTKPHQSTLFWTAPTMCVDGSSCVPTGYNVYRASVACPATGIPTGATLIASAITTTTYTDTPLAPGTYCWYVTALNSAGESGPSNTAGGSVAQAEVAGPAHLLAIIQ